MANRAKYGVGIWARLAGGASLAVLAVAPALAQDPAGGNAVLLFETDAKGPDAKVTSWRIGVPPAIDYVEGCG